MGTITAYPEADYPWCGRAHGVVTARVPWVRHGAGHTKFFDDQVVWLASGCSRITVTAMVRLFWRTVGSLARGRAPSSRPAPFRRTGIAHLDR